MKQRNDWAPFESRGDRDAYFQRTLGEVTSKVTLGSYVRAWARTRAMAARNTKRVAPAPTNEGTP